MNILDTLAKAQPEEAPKKPELPARFRQNSSNWK